MLYFVLTGDLPKRVGFSYRIGFWVFRCEVDLNYCLVFHALTQQVVSGHLSGVVSYCANPWRFKDE